MEKNFEEKKIGGERESLLEEEFFSLLNLNKEEKREFEKIFSEREKTEKKAYQVALVSAMLELFKKREMLGNEKEMYEFVVQEFGVAEPHFLQPEDWKGYPMAEVIIDPTTFRPKILLNPFFSSFSLDQQLAKLVEMALNVRLLEKRKKEEDLRVVRVENKIIAVKKILEFKKILALGPKTVDLLTFQLNEAQKVTKEINDARRKKNN